MSTTMTIRLEPELKERLDQLAQATQRSKTVQRQLDALKDDQTLTTA